jgi:flagellar hook-length control protein FliK
MYNNISVNGSARARAASVASASGAKVSFGGGAIQSSNPGLSGDITGEAAQVMTAANGVSPFEQVYKEIALSNISAQDKNGAISGTKAVGKDSALGTDDSQDATAQSLLASELMKEMSIQSTLGAGPGQGTGDLSAAGVGNEANQLLQKAIITIAQTLNLKVQDGIENITLDNPSQGVTAELAEMISALKGIASLLDDAVKAGQPIEYGTTTFDVQQAADVQKTIHEQVFQIEMALKLAGVSGDVANSVAQIDNTAASSSGITQAADPSTLSMPSIHVQQVLGQQIVTKEQKVQRLFSSLVSALQEKGTPDSAAMLQKIASVAVGTGSSSSTVPDAGTMDAQVLRKLLKVDGDSSVEESAKENAAAAKQNVTMDLPKSQGVVYGTTLETVLSKVKNDKDTAQMAAADIKSADTVTTQGSARLPDTQLSKQVDESVMNQVVDKLNVAVKSGITEMRIMLRPESLGDVQLRIRMEGDVVMGKIYVENQQVKHIVEANLTMLKDALAQHNLQVGSFDVDVNHGNDTRDQMQMMAELAALNAKTAGQSEDGSEASAAKNGAGESVMTNGMDTKRRFGNNTIELFA